MSTKNRTIDDSELARLLARVQDEVVSRAGLADAIRRAFGGETVQTPTVWYDPKELRHVQVREANRVAIASTFFPLCDERGAVAYVAVTYKDVTAELAAKERAEAERDRLALALAEKGIRPELLPTIFDRFAQERQSLDRSAGGLGLGLAIVRSLVSMHGGTVEARSDGPGHDAEITVSLPSVAVPGAETGAGASIPTDGASDRRRVLVVDDNEDAADLLAEALQRMGHDVAVAHDAASALRLLESTTPGIGLLDLGLRDMDGFELARRIHTRGQESDRRAAHAAGFADLLVKPASLERLATTIRNLAR